MKTAYFFKRFISKPGTVGALTPSSRSLAKQMVAPVNFNKIDTIVEYGAGTGVFTKYIYENLNKERTLFFSFEIDDNLYEISKELLPNVEIIKASASTINDQLKQHGKTHADAIISSLPWSVFSDELQDEILDATINALSEDGYFTTFTYIQAYYLPAACKIRKKFKARFSEVKLSKVVWKNFPPALVYWCKK